MCRHTIGMADALREADMNAEARIDDGFPESLEADIARYGLRWFKIKIGGDREANLDRLRRIGETLSECRAAPFHATLDGNEQVEDLGDLEWLHERLGASDAGRAMREAILYVEQPLARDRALAEDARGAIARLARLWPLIIDESDDDVAAFPRALELGYAGVSAKNCKGVFKSILNQCLIARRAEDGESPPAFLSAEDLTATGVVSLQEDLATIAALGLPHCERNGHHYFRGLDRLSAAEREGALAAHGDLYERRAGTVALRIADGAIALGSIRSPGFGYACSIDFEGRMTLDAWRSGRR
jgi:hypothetical protein